MDTLMIVAAALSAWVIFAEGKKRTAGRKQNRSVKNGGEE